MKASTRSRSLLPSPNAQTPWRLLSGGPVNCVLRSFCHAANRGLAIDRVGLACWWGAHRPKQEDAALARITLLSFGWAHEFHVFAPEGGCQLLDNGASLRPNLSSARRC